MSHDPSKTLDIKNGVASFVVHVPGAPEPRVIKRVSDIRRQVILIGREDDPAALTDLRNATPDLALRLPRPVAHTFTTNQPHKVVIVVGPSDVLATDEIVEDFASKPMNHIVALSPRFVLSLEMMHELQVVTGMSGSGRRKYVNEQLRRAEGMVGPDQLAIVKTATTRQVRSMTDSLYYDFLTPEQFDAKRIAGELIQVSTYGNVSYGIDRAHLLNVMQNQDGICILVESQVNELQRLGFPVTVTEIGMPQALFPPSAPEDKGGPTIH